VINKTCYLVRTSKANGSIAAAISMNEQSL